MSKYSGLRLLLLSLFAAASLPAKDEFPTWAYPVAAPTPAGATSPADDDLPQRVPGSSVTLTKKQFAAHVTSVADWHPEDHPAMPAIVTVGREPAVWACAYCHLPNGAGRPENASLAGLTPGYIKQQVAEFKNGNRTGSEPKRAPQNFMIALAKALTDDEIAQAAAYFSSLKPESFVKVVEAESVPKAFVAGAMLARVPAGGEEAWAAASSKCPRIWRARTIETRAHPTWPMFPWGALRKARHSSRPLLRARLSNAPSATGRNSRAWLTSRA